MLKKGTWNTQNLYYIYHCSHVDVYLSVWVIFSYIPFKMCLSCLSSSSDHWWSQTILRYKRTAELNFRASCSLLTLIVFQLIVSGPVIIQFSCFVASSLAGYNCMLYISWYLWCCVVQDEIQSSHFPWRARRRCVTAWGRRRRSSWCGRGCTWPSCWWRTWPEDRRHSRASREPVHSNSISEDGEGGDISSADSLTGLPPDRKHILSSRGRMKRGGLGNIHPWAKSRLIYFTLCIVCQ